MRRLFVTAVVLAAFTASAQWTADSTENLQICDLAGEQVLPKIVPTSDCGCFISWFDQRSGDYCVYLQRLDYQGIPQFPDNGILVSDHPQMTWLVDYSMAVDNEDNAVIAFSDIRSAEEDLDVSVYKISSTGNFLWGPDGISLSDTSEAGFEPNPVIAVTGENNCIFAWGKQTSEYFLVMQKLSPDGTRLWGDWGINITDPEADLSIPVLVPSGEDSVIAMWRRSTGSYPMTVTHLYTDMFDVNGNGIWGDSPVLIYDSGAITPWNNPGMISDGLGGAVCSWYDAPSLSEFNVWVQHLDIQGNMLYPMNGAQASTNSSDRLHMSPSAGINPATGETWVFWVETNGNQDQWGLYGQMFDSSGDRQWTDSGLELIPLGNEQIGFVQTSVDEYGIFVSYFINSSATSFRVFRLNFDGTVIWGPVEISAGSLGGKDDPVSCTGYGGSRIFSWTDNRIDAGIYAQNLKQDGSMGPFMGIDGESSANGFSLSVSPNPSSGNASISITSDATSPYAVLALYDISGRLVDTLYSGELISGENTFSWQSEGSASGIYLVRLQTEGGETQCRLVMLH